MHLLRSKKNMVPRQHHSNHMGNVHRPFVPHQARLWLRRLWLRLRPAAANLLASAPNTSLSPPTTIALHILTYMQFIRVVNNKTYGGGIICNTSSLSDRSDPCQISWDAIIT